MADRFLINGVLWVRADAHDARTKELLQANNHMLEQMRKAKREAQDQLESIISWLINEGITSDDLNDGWWETSGGVKYGEEIIQRLREGAYRVG